MQRAEERTDNDDDDKWKMTRSFRHTMFLPLHFLCLNMDRSTNKLNTMPRQMDTAINIQSCTSAVVRIVSTNVILLNKFHKSSDNRLSISMLLLPLCWLLLLMVTVRTTDVGDHGLPSALYVLNNICSRRGTSSENLSIVQQPHSNQSDRLAQADRYTDGLFKYSCEM